MKIAIDVYYQASGARTVGVLFRDWTDQEPVQTIISHTDQVAEYEPGNFYKRELPCIMELLKQVDLPETDIIVVDGYVFLDNDKRPGLGYYLFDRLEQKIPIVGVAKTSFHNNDLHVAKVYRGDSRNPLYITSIGIDLQEAAKGIQEMHGLYRMPLLLKMLDQETKKDRFIN